MDRLRSAWARLMRRRPAPVTAPQLASSLPRVIHGLWFQGLAQAPPLVRFNLQRWARLNPGYEVRVLDRSGVDALLAGLGLPLDGMEIQALSDVVRVRLLLLLGGVWVDATTFPSVPLDDWLPPLLQPSGFFAFERPFDDRLISPWFMAAAPGNAIVAAWWEEIVRYWSRPRQVQMSVPADPLRAVAPGEADRSDIYPYHWVQYLLEYVLTTQPDLAAQYASGVHRSAVPGRRLRERLERDLGDGQGWPPLAELAGAPVHKLNWRSSYPLEQLAEL